MEIFYKDSFKKSYKKRFADNDKKKRIIKDKVSLFLQDPSNPLLHVHPLRGTKQGFYAFSVTGDVRIVYYKKGKAIYFVDIGTHNQVYQ